MRLHISWSFWFKGLGVSLCCLTLAACSMGKTDTAWQLIQQQQEQQAMVRQHEAQDTRKNMPTEPDILMAMIQETQAQGRYYASLAYIDAYYGQFGRQTNLDALRAHALRMTGQPEQSAVVYKSLLGTAQAAEGHHGLGLLAASAGDYGLAVTHMAQAAGLQPTNASILNDLGFARLHVGDVDGARLPLGQAAELDPDNPKVLSNLALWLILQGNSAQAQAVMDKAALNEDTRMQIFSLASQLRQPAHRAAVSTAARPVVVGVGQNMAPQPAAMMGGTHSPLLR
ncbi:MAG: hypothetical protein KA735_13855 [Burkholderiaceae bacterium]|nr:hypothetical protein [Burkholderiaceae bacterium]